MKPLTPLKLFVPLLIVLLSLLGCSGGLDVQMVEGTVTLNGTPLDSVVLTFVPDDGGVMGYAKTNEQGKYKLSTLTGREGAGTTVGTYKVSFEKTIEDVSKRRGDIPNFATIQVVPKKYLDAKTSGFAVEVEKGKNVFNFDLVGQ